MRLPAAGRERAGRQDAAARFPAVLHARGCARRAAADVKVAVLGLTNPGIAIWDKANVQGKMTFPGLEEQAAKWVPKLRSMGADVVIVSAHSGISGTSSLR